MPPMLWVAWYTAAATLGGTGPAQTCRRGGRCRSVQAPIVAVRPEARRPVGVRLAQGALEDLPAGVARQLVDEHDAGRLLVAGEVLAAVIDEFALGHPGPRGPHVVGERRLDPPRLRQPDHCNVGDPPICATHCLDFDRIVVLAA